MCTRPWMRWACGQRPKPVAGAWARVAAHMHETAAHADRLAAQRTSKPLTGVALDFQRSAFHSGARERARIAANCQLSARHQSDGFDTDFPFDADGACGHARADTIETLSSAFDKN